MPIRLAVLLVVLLGAARGSAQELIKDSPFFPLKIGSQWTYRADDKRVVLRLTGQEKVDDTLCAVLETKRPDGLAITEHVAVKSDGVYRYRAMRLRVEPPVCFLKFGRTKEPTWEVKAKLGADTIAGTCKLETAEVDVPMGKFQTLRVTSELERGKEMFKIVSYFARDIGMVKQEQLLAGKKIMLELEKYETGK